MSLLGAGAATSVAPPARPDHLGTDFWVTFPRNSDGSSATNSLTIAAPRPTSGTVSYPGGSSDFAVTVGLSTTVSLPSSLMLDAATTTSPQSKAVHITALDEVSVVVVDSQSASVGDYLALPTDVAGTEHIVLGWPALKSQAGFESQFAVVATSDDTQVTYTPKATTRAGVTAGTSTSASLNKGDVLAVSSTVGDLSGTPVSSTKPVGVIAGNACANVPTVQTDFCDLVIEQIPPTSTWGTSFYTVPLKTRLNGDSFRILASEDNTTVRLNGVVIATLQRGQVHARMLQAPMQITADKPILIAQYATGAEYDSGSNADPLMMLLPPVDQFLSEYTFATRSAPDSRYANLVVPTSAVGQVSLDGAAIPGSAFSPIPATTYSWAQITVMPGAHNLVSPQPLGVSVYGYAYSLGYGTAAGSGFAPYNAVQALQLTPGSQQVQIGTSACLSGKALDNKGAGLAGIPVELGIRGTNTITDRVFSDMSGSFSYCYSAARAGVDSVAALFRGVQSEQVTIEWIAPTPQQPTQLPITVTKLAGKRATLGSHGKLVLVKGIATNPSGLLTFAKRCKPRMRQAGARHTCKVTVSPKGKVTVVSAGYGKLRVWVKATASPVPGQETAWLPNTWTKRWKVRA